MATAVLFQRDGDCKQCGNHERLASEREPFCLDCYKWMVIPTPICQSHKGVLDTEWRGKPDGHPRRGIVRFLKRKVVEDEDV